MKTLVVNGRMNSKRVRGRGRGEDTVSGLWAAGLRSRRDGVSDLLAAPGVERVVDGELQLELTLIGLVQQREAVGDGQQTG